MDKTEYVVVIILQL